MNDRQHDGIDLTAQLLGISEELQAAHEELRVADEELRAQQEQISELLHRYRESTLLSERLFSSLPVAVLLTDRSGLVREVNGAAAALLRRRHVELLHKPLPVLVAVEDRTTVRATLASLDGHARHLDIRVTSRSGAVPVIAVVSPEPGEAECLRWLLLPTEGVPGAGSRSAGISALAALSALCRLPSGGDLPTALTRASALAHAALPEADAVSIHIGDPAAPEAVGSDSKLAQAFDYAELRADEGPCLDAYRDGVVVNAEDVLDPSRWPALTREAVGLGVRSALAVPLVSGQQVHGALNLFAAEPGAFSEESAQLAGLFGETVWAIVEEVHEVQRLRTLADQLQTALGSRAVIEQAKGMLAVGLGCGVEDAFGVLRAVSQRTNRKLHDIAVHVVEHAGEPLDRVLAIPPRPT